MDGSDFGLSLNSDQRNYRESELDTIQALVGQFQGMQATETNAGLHPAEFMANFSRFVRTTDITRLLAIHELYQKVKNVQGSIVEIGVLNGFNVFNFAHFVEIYEHRNYTRQVLGFDTFEGYPTKFHAADNLDSENSERRGDVKTSSFETLERSVDIFNSSVIMNQFDRIRLIKGDVLDTVPSFVKDNGELVVALLLCHTDIYGPTRVALEHFLPLMPKGGIVAFGGTNWRQLPGESVAMKEAITLNTVKLERLDFATKLSFFEIQ